MSAQSKVVDTGFTVRDLPSCFQPGYSQGLSAHYRLALRQADQDPAWFTLSIRDGICGLEPGETELPDCTLIFDPPTLEDLISGLSDVATLYAQRRLGIKGDIGLALKFPKLFVLQR